MTGPRRVYPYPCPDCGRIVNATAAYRARHRRPCLACTRVRNAWHRPECTGPGDHPGPCPV